MLNKLLSLRKNKKMTSDQIISYIENWVREKKNTLHPKVTLDSNLDKDLDLDSLDKMELLFDLEVETEIVFDEMRMKKVVIVSDIVEHFRR